MHLFLISIRTSRIRPLHINILYTSTIIEIRDTLTEERKHQQVVKQNKAKITTFVDNDPMANANHFHNDCKKL